MSIQLIATPEYSDLFGEKPPRFQDLVAEIPLNQALEYGCLVSSLFYWRNDKMVDLRILTSLVGRVDLQKLTLLKNWLESQSDSESINTGLFAPHYTLHYFHLCIISCSKSTSEIERTPELELTLFKALMLSNHLWNEQYRAISSGTNEVDFFRKNTWPIEVSQLVGNSDSNEVIALVKGMYFLKYMREQPDNNKYVEAFLKANGKNSDWDYILSIAGLWSSKSLSDAPVGISDANHSHRMILNDMALDRSYYSQEYAGGHRSFTGLKSHPIFKLSEDRFLVLNWGLLSEKLFDGVVRSFYQNSGISELPKFQSFHDFRRTLALDMIEKNVLRITIEGIFSKNHTVRVFDNKGVDGFFDALVIDGKSLFVFEIKDSLFPSEVIDSRNYEDIKEELDRKYNCDKKGTGQLERALKRMLNGRFSSILPSESVPDFRKLTLYPILVYTDSNYGESGKSLYLQEQFKARLSSDISDSFRHIYPLTFCSLDYLIENIDLFSNPKWHLSKVISFCSNQVKIRRKNFSRIDGLKKMMLLNESFERISFGFIGWPSKRKKSVEKLLTQFGVTHDLRP